MLPCLQASSEADDAADKKDVKDGEAPGAVFIHDFIIEFIFFHLFLNIQLSNPLLLLDDALSTAAVLQAAHVGMLAMYVVDDILHLQGCGT